VFLPVDLYLEQQAISLIVMRLKVNPDERKRVGKNPSKKWINYCPGKACKVVLFQIPAWPKTLSSACHVTDSAHAMILQPQRPWLEDVFYE